MTEESPVSLCEDALDMYSWWCINCQVRIFNWTSETHCPFCQEVNPASLPPLPPLSLPPAHTTQSLKAYINKQKEGIKAEMKDENTDPELAMIEPFKRQVTWAVPLTVPTFSCSLCGRETSDDSFCVLCHLKQRQLVLVGLEETTAAQLKELQKRITNLQEARKANADAQRSLEQ